MVLPSAKCSKKDNPYMTQIVLEGREKGLSLQVILWSSITLQLWNKKQTKIAPEGKIMGQFHLWTQMKIF